MLYSNCLVKLQSDSIFHMTTYLRFDNPHQLAAGSGLIPDNDGNVRAAYDVSRHMSRAVSGGRHLLQLIRTGDN